MSTKILSYQQEKLLLLKKGDEKVFEQIFNDNYTIFTRLSYRFVQNQEVAEEIVQDVFLKFWDKRETISIEISLKAYLGQMVKNHSLNYLKSKEGNYQKLLKVDVEEHFVIDDETQNDVEFLEFQNLVEKSINKLPDRSQEIFKMNRYDGLSYSKIATQLDISVKAVEKQMSQALSKMRDFLAFYNK